MRHLYRPPIVHLDRKGHKWLGLQVRSKVINHLGSPCIFFWLFILCLTSRLSRNEIEPFFKHSHNPLGVLKEQPPREEKVAQNCSWTEIGKKHIA
jgi:hypothetical protein